jgi:hypothetical protein
LWGGFFCNKLSLEIILYEEDIASFMNFRDKQCDSIIDVT